MLDTISKMIERLGIQDVKLKPSSILGETDVGLDSQELIDLTCSLEKEFKFKFPHQFLNKKSTVQDILNEISRSKQIKARADQFKGTCETSILIKTSLDDAYNAIFQMEKWPEKLPHVPRIEVLYNDGVYQEFLMDVKSERGLIKVRSVRRCLKNESILFFQPSPPIFLKNHCGGWKFHKHPKGCYVTTWHHWNPDENSKMSGEEIEEMLLGHANFALNQWKKILEGEKHES